MIQIVAQRQFGEGKPVFVFPEPQLPLIPNLETVFKKHHDILAMLPETERYNLFYTLAHHTGAREAVRPSRTNTTFEYQSVLPFDIDDADGARGLEYAEVLGGVLDVPVANITIVASGNGVHLLIHLQHMIRSSSFFKENRHHYREILDRAARGLEAKALPGKFDPSVFEPARVLRLPGTINRKEGKDARECSLVQYSDARLDIDLGVASGLAEVVKQNVSMVDIRRNYPRPDFVEMVKECRFIQDTLARPAEQHEPQVFDLLSLFAYAPRAARVDHHGEKNPEELGRWVFEHATDSSSLRATSFEEKWEQAGRYGGRKCETIHQRWGTGCEACPHFGKIPTPLALKAKDFIGSAVNGYWVMNTKGQPSHPHYEDLSRVYRNEHAATVTADERVFAFETTHYRELPDIDLKAWLERSMVPTEPVREMHRNEFIHKLRATARGSKVSDAELFDLSTRGKLNLSNGILDLRTGHLAPSSPDVGFKYVLPYAYDPHAECEFFLDWLSEILQNRVELMDSVLDLMAYTIWPDYDDHVFAYLIGDGANGKSTFMHVMSALVGEDNVAAINIQQLAANRFAPAGLEGKLVNLSEESSGYEMSYEEANIIKTLSSGGSMMVERKGVQGYSFTNRAKLIFSANHKPRFHEGGHALKRRLLVIPFDHRIETPDSTVETRLLADVPGILALLVRRIQENVGRNGRFIVYRGGSAAGEAQKEMLRAGSTVYEWAKENLEWGITVDEEPGIAVKESYSHYRQWCDEMGYRQPVHQVVFGKTLLQVFGSACTSSFKWVDGKSQRVYTRVRYRKEPARES